MSQTPDAPAARIPEKPSIDGIESVWSERWEADATYRFDRTRPRAEVYSIDTPPPTVSRLPARRPRVLLHAHRPASPATSACAASTVFYPMGWDDNGLPTERRVQNYYGVRCDPTLPYDPDFTPPAEAGRRSSQVADQPHATSSSCASS